jgi:methionyl-tRNA formyltransferase
MNLIIAGKNNIAVDVLKFALENLNIPTFVVLNKTENFQNNFQKSLGFYAKRWNVTMKKLEDIYDLNDSIFLSLEFDRIIKPDLFRSKNLFNIHFSLLPAYKGMYTSALPILDGENKSGVTLHRIDSGIDTGEIIAQTEIKINSKDTARDLYIKYIDFGTKLVIKHLSSLIDNSFNSRVQSNENSTYFSKKSIDYNNLKINFFQTAFQISNQIRAYNFREFQLPKFNDIEIRSSVISKNRSSSKPGTIIGENDYSLVVSTIDFDIILEKDLFGLICNYCETNDYVSLERVLNYKTIDLEEKTKQGWTPLMIAAYNHSLESVDLLIKKGADVNAQNYNLTSVLMYAKSNSLISNSFKIIEKLIENGANIYLKDIYGKNVIDWVKNENKELYEYFKTK